MLSGDFGVCICVCVCVCFFVCFYRSGQMGDKEGEDLGSLVFVAPLRDPELGCRMCRCLSHLCLFSCFFLISREEREGEQVTVL